MKYFIEIDCFQRRKHIYLLLIEKEPGIQNCIASYSLKTKRLIIKCANEHIPEKYILQDFVKHCEEKGEWNI